MQPKKLYSADTWYGRRKLRKQARNTKNDLPGGKEKFLANKQGCMVIFIVGIATLGVIMYFALGIDGLRDLLKFL